MRLEMEPKKSERLGAIKEKIKEAGCQQHAEIGLVHVASTLGAKSACYSTVL